MIFEDKKYQSQKVSKKFLLMLPVPGPICKSLITTLIYFVVIFLYVSYLPFMFFKNFMIFYFLELITFWQTFKSNYFNATYALVMTPKLYVISFFFSSNYFLHLPILWKKFLKICIWFSWNIIVLHFLLYSCLSLDVVAQAYNSSTLKTGGRRSWWVQAQPVLSNQFQASLGCRVKPYPSK